MTKISKYEKRLSFKTKHIIENMAYAIATKSNMKWDEIRDMDDLLVILESRIK